MTKRRSGQAWLSPYVKGPSSNAVRGVSKPMGKTVRRSGIASHCEQPITHLAGCARRVAGEILMSLVMNLLYYLLHSLPTAGYLTHITL